MHAQWTSGRVCRNAVLVLALVSFNPAFTTARGVDLRTMKRFLKSSYVGQVLTLRNFYESSKLEYTSDGALRQIGKAGDWTLNGAVTIQSFNLQKRRLELSCKRVALEYDADKELFRSRPSSLLQIDVEIEPSNSEPTYLESVMNKIFLSPEEKLADLVPVNLRSALGVEASVGLSKDRVKVSGRDDLAQTLRNGEKFVPAICQQCPTPGYSNAARQAKMSGDVTLWIVVDERGNVADAAIIKPAGSGLDEESVKTVETWTFKPATVASKPVKYRTALDVSFRLY